MIEFTNKKFAEEYYEIVLKVFCEDYEECVWETLAEPGLTVSQVTRRIFGEKEGNFYENQREIEILMKDLVKANKLKSKVQDKLVGCEIPDFYKLK